MMNIYDWILNLSPNRATTYLILIFFLMNIVAAGPLLAEPEVVVSALNGYSRPLTTLLANVFWRSCCCLRRFLLCCSRLRECLRRWGIPIHASDLIHIEHLRWYSRQGVVPWQEIGSLALHGLRKVKSLEIRLRRGQLLDGPWCDL